MHPDIVEMVALARALGAETELITNGLLLGSVAGDLVEAGLDRLVVSVDGASPEAHADARSGSDLRLVHENVDRLLGARATGNRGTPEIGIEFVATRRNVHELPGLRRLALTMGASFVVVTNLLPYTEDTKDDILYGLWAGRSFPGARSRWSPEIILPRIDARREALGPLVGLLESTGVVGPFPWPVEAGGYCRFVGEGSIAVGWDGEVSPCVALMRSYSCYVLGRAKQVRRHTLGNVACEDVAAIYGREEYVRFRERVRRFDFAPCTDCGACELAETNEADCFGNSFPVCGDCLWARGVIQCP
jgi:MoaA/NifB/PqqE/SkfB family radical SAM enzyme